MLTEDQVADQLRIQLLRETAAIRPGPDLLTDLHRRQARRSLVTRAGLAAIPAAAVAAAVTVALIVSAGSGGTAPPRTTVLTAATIQRMASQSRLALAQSGRAAISYRLTDNGAAQSSGTDSITFAGGNWNDVISQTSPASHGQPAHTQVAIDRIVNGQFYLNTAGKDSERWYHDTNPAGHPGIKIPDPRTLLGLLDPSARFEVTGHRVVGGLRLTELRGTNPPRLRALDWLPGVAPGAHVESLTVWVDQYNVVHQMSLNLQRRTTTKPIYLRKAKNGSYEILVPSKAYLKDARAVARQAGRRAHVTVGIDPDLPAVVHHHTQVATVSAAFSGFGQPQVIAAPQHTIPQYGRG